MAECPSSTYNRVCPNSFFTHRESLSAAVAVKLVDRTNSIRLQVLISADSSAWATLVQSHSSSSRSNLSRYAMEEFRYETPTTTGATGCPTGGPSEALPTEDCTWHREAAVAIVYLTLVNMRAPPHCLDYGSSSGGITFPLRRHRYSWNLFSSKRCGRLETFRAS